MACPTCDHTMQSFGELVYRGSIFWCPRCGTVRIRGESDNVPKLPARVRELLTRISDYFGADGITAEAHRLGVTEAVTVPRDEVA